MVLRNHYYHFCRAVLLRYRHQPSQCPHELWAALILIFWAIAFAGNPANASIVPEFEDIYGTTDLACRLGVENGESY